MSINQRIAALRQEMAKHGLAAYIIPATDPHQSEYIAPHWQGMTYMSAFDGSAGTVVITANFAGLWTDSRYFLQAERQLAGSEMQLMKLPKARKPNQVEWLAENLHKGEKVGIDAQVLSIAGKDRLEKAFQANKIVLEPTADLLQAIWEDRPEIPVKPILFHEVVFTGKSRADKIAEIQAKMATEKIDFHLLTALDDIAWTFNIRGKDIAYNPVVIAYAVIGKAESHLFINEKKLSAEQKAAFAADHIQLHPYEAIASWLSQLSAKQKIRFSNNQISFFLHKHLPKEVIADAGKSIPTLLKGNKNETELANIRHAMVRDGVALVHFLRWLEVEGPTGKVTEVIAQEKLHALRAAQDRFMGDSFHAIAGYGSHGAIVHYRATEETSIPLEPKGLFLLDSGGQYLDGTTDITRTIAMGELTEEEKRDYTLVLMGHISLALAHFRQGTTGANLDILAREAMWREGIDYGHGTGHGVGFFLNVHEGPQGISQTTAGGAIHPLEPGMIISNEPGIYRPGKHGVRIENLVAVTPAQQTEFGTFYRFETLTLCPIDTTPIVVEMLSERQRGWLNTYHEMVYERLSKHLNSQQKAWLAEKTKAI